MQGKMMVLLLVAACGGSTSTPTSGAIAGSYDVSFSNVAVDRTGTIWGGIGGPALETAHGRLDITGDSNGGYAAQLTPEWGEPQGFTVTVSNDAIVLAGEATFNTSNTNATISDRVATMRLARAGNGLAGSGSVTGTENVFEGDVGDTSNLTANILVAKDTTAPRVRDDSPSGAGAVHLPWDAIVVQASEPIDMDKLRAQTSLGTSPLAYGTDRSHTTSIEVYASDWDALPSAKLQIAGGIADPSGNASVAYAGDWKVLDVGKPVASVALGMGTWGKFAMASAPCESGSCLEIGPAQSWCDSVGSGIAARLVAKGKKSVVVRYRLRAQNQFGGPGQMTLRVAVARPGEASFPTAFTPMLAQTGEQDYPYASQWATVTAAMPNPISSAADEVGVAVSISSAPGFCGGPAPEPSPFVADIQSITTE